MLKIMFLVNIDANAKPMSTSCCIESLATNRIAMMSACDLTAGKKFYV